MQIILATVLCLVITPFQITFQSCQGNQTQVYPQQTTYSPDTCECLNKIQICSTDLIIRFKELIQTESLYYQFSQPLFIQQYQQVNSTEITNTVPLSFKGIGSQKLLYFQYQQNNVEMHFSFVNKVLDQQGNYPQPFDSSYIILSSCVAIIIMFVTNQLKIYRFQALSIQWWFAILYIIIFTAYILVMDFTNGIAVKYTQYILLGALCIFSSFFMVGELAIMAGVKCKLWRLDVRDIIAALVTIGLILMRILVGNTWYVNDILGLIIVKSLLKVFRVRSLRASLFFLIVTIVVDIGLQLGYILSGSRVGLKLINEYPSPLELQIPTLTYFSTKRCNWVQLTDVYRCLIKLLFSGLLVNYCRRLDASFNISVYTFVASTCIFLGLGLQITIYVATGYKIELPQSVFSVPLLLMLLSLVSTRRGQWTIIWQGSFHDKTMSQISLGKSVEWNNLTKDIEKNLLVN